MGDTMNDLLGRYKIQRVADENWAIKSKELFPIYYEGVPYEEENCHRVYIAFLATEMVTNSNGGVDMSDGWIYPNGMTTPY